MLSFFGEQGLKDAVVARVKEHQRLDQIVQRIYWDGSKGCAIGCVLHSDDHMAFERQLGLPAFLAYMDEHIFESLPAHEATQWPLRFIEAVPVGVDLDLVFPRFMYWLLTDSLGVRAYANVETAKILDTLARMYSLRIDGIAFEGDAARSAARSAACSAARSAAWSAARSAESAARSAESAAWSAAENAWSAAESAESAAWSAARSAAWSAESAAWSAARSAAWSAARSAEINRQADFLISLLQAYESTPLNTGPCPEKIREFLPTWSAGA
jgi:hypothetical protein